MRGYLRHLANFAEIGRSGSLAGAAERLGTTVSVMSRSLAILENHYGFPLVLRNARGVVPTEAGRLVMTQAANMVGAAMQALDIGRGESPIAGEVVFSAPREVLQLWLVDALAEILANHPSIRLTVLAADEVLDAKRQRLDVSLRVGAGAPDMAMDCFFEQDVCPVLVCRPEVRTRLQAEQLPQIAGIDFLRFRPFGPVGKMVLQAKTAQAQPIEIDFQRQTPVTDVMLAIELARAGAGVVGCLEPSVRGALQLGTLVEAFPSHGFAPAKLRISTPKGHQTPAAVLVCAALSRAIALRLGAGV